MWIQKFKLIKKLKLTNDIFEIHFKWEEIKKNKPWQFITLLVPEIWWRSYSILNLSDNIVKLIIKRVKNWRWWSKYICDMNLWELINWVWPAGHFTLKENENNKLFMWTWTWFVPLYNMIINWLKDERLKNTKFKLLFGTKTKDDLFYLDELKKLKNNFQNFDYNLYLSREETDFTTKWYVTDYLNIENIKKFSEFYLCWINSMIESSIEILRNNWIKEEHIFKEIY